LHTQGKIDSSILRVSFNLISSDDPDGVLPFGKTDPSGFTGDITYAPITSTPPASHYWGIDVAMMYGGATIMPRTAGIVDTDTTLILVASGELLSCPVPYPVVLYPPVCFLSDAFPGLPDRNWRHAGSRDVTLHDQYDALQPLTVTVGDTPFVQLRPLRL
jgi:hypothetical protein